MKAYVRVGEVEVRWTAKDTREVRRMVTHAGGVAAAVTQPGPAAEEERSTIGFAAQADLDPER